MENWLQFYQELPLRINPLAFHIGFVQISWYALMYLVGFAIVYYLLVWRIKKKEGDWREENIQEFLIYAFLGVVIGGRLGYVIFYNLPFYLNNPLAIISPFNQGAWTGIYGMSYHGGLIGMLIATVFFCRKNKLNSLSLADFIVPAIPAGYFFGRIGNFLNGELYGRITAKPWGMYFLDENSLIMRRHPSQLYEAFFEGIILFLILWLLRNGICLKNWRTWLWQSTLRRDGGHCIIAPPKQIARANRASSDQKKMFHVPSFMLYVLGYAFFRFWIEFFRQPDAQVGLFFGFLTLGQIFSVGMMGLVFLIYGHRKKGSSPCM